MTTCETYTGDLKILFDKDSDWDLYYQNGQPYMTDGFDTAFMLSVFGEPNFWQNDLTNNPSEKYISEFPGIIKQANVSQKTLLDGIEAIKKSLAWAIDDQVCESLEVTGSITNVYAISWNIDVIRGGISSRYSVNWDKGVIAAVKSCVM